jgi:hypothetical protein
MLEGRITPSDLLGEGPGEIAFVTMAASGMQAPSNVTLASYGAWTTPALPSSQTGIYFT